VADLHLLTSAQQERSVLGGMMLDSRVVWDVAEILEPGDFADGRYETVFRAILALANSRQPTDVLAVTDWLQRERLLVQTGGQGVLHEILSDTISAWSAPFHAEAVKQAAIKRRIREAGMAILGMASEDGDAFEVATRASAEIARATEAGSVAVAPVGDSVDAVIDSLSEAPRFVPTPWAGLNDLVGGFRPGALYVIGARPGAGKTILGLQSAVRLASRGPVAFASLEMSVGDLTKRLFAQRATVAMRSLTTNNLSPLEWEKVAAARESIARLPLFIDDRSGVTINHVRAFARSIARKGPLAGVVVDYLQLMRATDPKRPRWEAVGEISVALKGLARDLDVPVIALSQLNRGSEATGAGPRRLPTLGDLRESGSIEQDADVVMLLQREWDEIQDAPSDVLSVSVGKNRHGMTGIVRLGWEAFYARVVDLPA
jgi:replicative DNA helicase